MRSHSFQLCLTGAYSAQAVLTDNGVYTYILFVAKAFFIVMAWCCTHTDRDRVNVNGTVTEPDRRSTTPLYDYVCDVYLGSEGLLLLLELSVRAGPTI